ncbi:hypothetical protein M378DRAFT_170271 [Amanita muscaria Koide BX008]|uniref:Uncharacterized protein n=1 Tax=Amanita muscaria (strain Koide BX008) TaxID=946122 RepID=A0A0C2WBP8_AMAMK|nr:hypothetical protein M378DRAFT_170271 [Amanita muscaria Koide BX008]
MTLTISTCNERHLTLVLAPRSLSPSHSFSRSRVQDPDRVVTLRHCPLERHMKGAQKWFERHLVHVEGDAL